MKKLLATMLAMSMAASLAACGGSDKPAETKPAGTEAPAAPGETQAPAAEGGALTGTLKVGSIGPLTGGAALYGSAVDYACQIAVEEINALGGMQIEYKGEDDEHDAEKSINAYNSLKDWGVQTIVGCVTTTPCVAVSAEANSDRVFMLTPSASGPAVVADKDQTFQLCFSDPNQGSASAQYIADNNLATKIAIIYNNADAYSSGIYQTFEAKAAELNLEVVSVTTFTDETANDFSVQIADAQNAGADLVFLPIYYTPASLILQQSKAVNYAPVFFGVDGMDGILDIKGFDTSLAEGVLLLTPFAADAQDEATQSFVGKFEAAHGIKPNQFAADAYDCVYALYAALENYAAANGGLDVTDVSAEDMCEILRSTFVSDSFTVDGLTGEGMKWGETGEVNKAPRAVVIKDGGYVSNN